MGKEAIEIFFKEVISDMYAQNTKVPVSAFRVEATNIDGQLYAPDWFQYMIYGRGPGKQPPPQKIIDWVKRNPDILQSAKQTFKYINEKGLAFLIGRKIGKEGTNIWQGKSKGVDLLESMEKNLPELMKSIAINEKFKIMTSLSKNIS